MALPPQKNKRMYPIIRPLLFRFPPEAAHHMTFAALRAASLLPFAPRPPRLDPRLSRRVFGLDFPSPVGLAAGLDKDAVAFGALGAMGFGFVEVGTLTPRPQPGNPRPRLFRLTRDKALVNRMGFNNQGVEAAALRLAARPAGLVVGGNIGKNKDTPNERAADDYRRCFEVLYPVVDYFVVNVSSPNTPGLRELQERRPLSGILGELRWLNAQRPVAKPILLKIAPDLNEHQLDDIARIVLDTGIDGVVATNTTLSRQGLSYPPDWVERLGAGGLSGLPLRERSTEVVRHLARASEGRFPIVGVGGILSARDALEKLEAGASLVQLYTGFIYRGPALIREIHEALLGR